MIIKKDILDLGKGSSQGLDDISLAAEADYSSNFTKQRKKFRSNSYIFVNASEICQFKAKDPEITTHFSVDWFSIGVGAIQNVHRYLMNKNKTKQCLDLFKKCL